MSDLLSFIGRPWALPCDPPRTYDCWELVVEVRKHLGRPIPSIQTRSERSLGDVAAYSDGYHGWKRLDEPVCGCVVLLGHPAKHCGVYFDDSRTIHSFSPNGVTGSVQFTRLNSLKRLFGNRVSFWEFTDGVD